MSGRISDERPSNTRVKNLARGYKAMNAPQTAAALKELYQLRLLEKKLRALAERWKSCEMGDGWHRVSDRNLGRADATRECGTDLTSLLAAHDTQQAEGRE